MKVYERYERVFGVGGSAENFLFFGGCQAVFFVHFASFGSYVLLCEWFEAVFVVVDGHFMNFMKVCEGGLIKRFFVIWVCFLVCFYEGVFGACFIDVHKFGGLG